MKKYENFFSNVSRNAEKSVVREILKLLEKPDIISFAGGLPSPESFPVKDIAEITSKVMENEAEIVLQYSTTEGDRVLKSQLIEYYNKRNYQMEMDNLLITSASQQALDIIGKVFINKNDKIILSLPSYLGAISAFKQYDPEFIGVELDEHGMSLKGLEKTLKDLKAKGEKPKFIYIIPDFQNPAGITMPSSRRKEILKLAQEYQVLIIEDSPYREIRFKGEEQASFYSLAQNDLVINIGTFSKILSPGFRLGWVIANKEIIEEMVVLKQSMDLCTSIFNQRIAGRYMEKGYFEKNISKIKELYKVLLVGKQDILEKELSKYSYDDSKIEVVHASQTISMEDEPSSSVRTKKDSSLMKTFSLYKEGKADAVVSAGNTGAAMAGSLFTYGRIKNVLRPAIATVLPTKKNPQVVLDVGANAECQAANLLQFAQLGSLYSKFFFKKEFPKVSLLNIGEEAKKGNELYKSTYELLQKSKNINFIGNIEGKELFLGNTDVIVCDGFSGNILLKTIEGTVEFLASKVKSELKKHFFAKLAILLFMRPILKNLKKDMDHSEYGGALLTGLNGITVITHGSSNSHAIANSIKFAVKIVNSGFMEYSKNFFEKDSE